MNAPSIGSKGIEVDPASTRVLNVMRGRRAHNLGRAALVVLSVAVAAYAIAWFAGAGAVLGDNALLALFATACATVWSVLSFVGIIGGWLAGVAVPFAAGAAIVSSVSGRREEARWFLLVALVLAAGWLALTRGVPLASIALLERLGA